MVFFFLDRLILQYGKHMERISRDTPFCETAKKMMSLAARQRICMKTEKAGSVVCKINREGICHRNETKKQQIYDNIKYETNLCAYLVPTLSGLDVNDLPHFVVTVIQLNY